MDKFNDLTDIHFDLDDEYGVNMSDLEFMENDFDDYGFNSDANDVNMSDLEFMGGSSDSNECENSDMSYDNHNNEDTLSEPKEFITDSEDTYEKYLEDQIEYNEYVPQQDTINYDNLPDPPELDIEKLDTKENVYQEQIFWDSMPQNDESDMNLDILLPDIQRNILNYFDNQPHSSELNSVFGYIEDDDEKEAEMSDDDE